MNKYSIFSLFTALMLCLGLVTSCSVEKQISELSTLAKCEYKLANLSGITLAGVNLENKNSPADLSVSDAAALSLAYLSSSYPLTMNVNVGVRNPNATPAAISRLAYIMTLEGTDLAAGTLNNGFQVGANAVNTLAIPITVDLKKVFAGQSQSALLNLILSLAGQSSKPTKLGLKIRPSFLIGGQPVDFPKYFDVSTEFTAGGL